MNETERERIMSLLAEGVLKPGEAAQLLAALAEGDEARKADAQDKAEKKEDAAKENGKEKTVEKTKQPTVEVLMNRSDGTATTVEVPASLVPMLMKLAGVAIKESARTAAQDTWRGVKIMTRNKVDEVRETVTTAFKGGGKKAESKPAPTKAEDHRAEARQRILQMVQNGRLSATDASRLIQELDALQAYEKTHD